MRRRDQIRLDESEYEGKWFEHNNSLAKKR